MSAGQIRPGDSKLDKVMEGVRTTPGEARKFASDPEGYLKSQGIATDGLRFEATGGELSDGQLDSVAGGVAASNKTICHSVGEIYCVSEGDDNQY
jgi:hypothetical protein